MLKRFFISMLGSLVAIWISLMLLLVLGMCFAVGTAMSTLSLSTSTVKVSKNSVLCLNLDHAIVEQPTSPNVYDLFNDAQVSESLSDIVNALESAKNDDNIAGLYIECGEASIGLAARETLRNAIADFGESGKWVVAYAESYTQGNYYVASAAKEIYLNPVGEVELRGLASGIPFFKGLLDKLGIEMQVVKVGTFKSAVEPYILTSMSDANRLQTSAYLESMWNGITSAISKSRGIEVENLNAMTDSMATYTSAEDLVSMKLVDGLKYGNEMTDYLKELTNRKHDDDLNAVSIGDYIASGVEMPHSKSNSNKIAVYYADGEITTSGKDGIASDRVVPDILDLADDDDIDAMVFRVNSVGGSAFASEQIWHALEVFKSKGKTLYVSMGDYAASGGYYISCGADKIYAQPLTLTGSIGIYGMMPCFKGLANDKLGINIDFVSTNANSAVPTPFEPMTPFQREKMQSSVNRGYELFTSRCAKGRNMPVDSIKAIAEGRVWDGVTAQKIGLVDELGSLNDAVEALAEAKGFKRYEVIAYPEREKTFFDLLAEMSTEMRANALKQEFGAGYPIYQRVKAIKEMDPIQAHMEESIVY